MKKPQTKKQTERRERIRELGCRIKNHECRGYTQTHHCGTGGGGRADHDKIIPLCVEHHTGRHGIDGKQLFTKRSWQEHYGTEDHHLQKVAELLVEA